MNLAAPSAECNKNARPTQQHSLEMLLKVCQPGDNNMINQFDGLRSPRQASRTNINK